MPAATATPTAPPRRRRRSTAGPSTTIPGMEAMKSTSFSLPPSLVGRMRAAQWHTQLHKDGHRNLSEFVRAVIEKEVLRLERKHNGGEPFPAVEKLPTGPSPEGARRGADLRALQREQDGQTEGRRKKRT